MTFSIEEFTSALGKRGGVMMPNRFLVTMPLPTVLLLNDDFGYYEVARDMEFWVTNVNLPGYQMTTAVTKRYTYGPDEKRPFAPVYQPIQMTVNCDNSGHYHKFFDAWTQCIMPHDWYNAFSEGSTFKSVEGGAGQYDVEYKRNYSVDMTIGVFNQAGELVLNYVIKEAFPVSLTDMQFDWEKTNEKQQFQVQFEYLDWVRRPNTTNPFGSEDFPKTPYRQGLNTTSPQDVQVA